LNQDDIKYILELLDDAITNKDWELAEDVKENLKEFIDCGNSNDNE
jgi:hypothetical protein